MTAAELDGFLRGELARLDKLRPGAARAVANRDQRWQEAKAALVSAVAGETGLPEAFVGDLLGRREMIGRQSPYNAAALREAADTGFVTAVMAAAAWTMATPKPKAGRT